MINGKQAAAVAMILIIAIPILMGYAFASEEVTKTEKVVDYSNSLSSTLLNSEAYYYDDYNGPENNGRLVKYSSTLYTYSFARPAYEVVNSSASSIPLGSAATYSFALTSGEYNDLSSFDYTEYTFETTTTTYIRLTLADGSTEIVPMGGSGLEVIRVGSTFMCKEPGYGPIESYSMVSKVEVRADSEASLNLHYYSTGNSQFADPAYGWALPDTTNVYFWANGYSNMSVRFYLHMDTPSSGTNTASIGPYSFNEISFTLGSTGLMTVSYRGTSYTLGNYNDLQISYIGDGGNIVVTGIAGWPSMGSAVAGSNSVTFTSTAGSGPYSMFEITGSTSTLWRCDYASVVAGTFPVTKNYSLDLNKLYPAKDWNLKINSIGIYGDTITIGGQAFTVTDNAITVGDKEIKLKGAVIEFTRMGQFYGISINGTPVVGYTTVSAIIFGGVWSLTATVDIMTTETVTVDEWVPGQFAFDKDTFILAIIFVAAAVFVALGFTAGRSGGKVLLLAVVCGGAAVIALMLV